MQRPLFLPTARQTNWLLIVGFLSVGWAMYLRYTVIEISAVSLACNAGLDTWLCLSRKVATVLYENSAIGAVALAIALLNLLRPSIVLFAAALAVAGLGIVLYNASLSSVAVAALMLSFARPAAAAE